MKDDYYWFWINNITGIANIKLRYLFKVFDTPEDIYKASDKMFEGVMGIKPDDIYSIKESRKVSIYIGNILNWIRRILNSHIRVNIIILKD